MKKIVNFFKALLYGIMPAIAGGCIVLDVVYAARNIKMIGVVSGWNVVLHFVLAVTEIFLAIALLYELGGHQINSRNWTKHVKSIQEESADTISSSTSDCETSNETTDTSSETKSKSKRKKS